MYWTIEQWMVTELGLTGAELHIYAIIYGYSRNGAGTFFGSNAALCLATGLSERTVRGVLRKLEDQGLLVRSEGFHEGTRTFDYKAVEGAKIAGGKKCPLDGAKIAGQMGQNLPPSPLKPPIYINKNNKEGDTETRVCAVPAEPARFVNLCPFGDEEIKELWGILLQQPKWRKKGANAIQQAAKMLGNVTAKTAFYMLQACIAGEWQGLHYPRPDELRTIESESFDREIEAARARIAARKAREAAERQKEGQQL